MPEADFLEGLKRPIARAEERLPGSVRQHKFARNYVPNGSVRSRFSWPFPTYIARGEGAYVYDVDGNRYIDLVLGHGPLILGHRHPAVIEAIRDQLERGLMFGPPVAEEAQLARVIVERVPNADWIGFFNSGTEATLAALRIARAATGRDKVAKFEGGHHGWHDFLTFSRHPDGPVETPNAMADGIGMSKRVAADIVMLPYNHPAAIDRILEEGDDLACVVVEGVQGAAGAFPSEPGFLANVRRACDKSGALLVMDEVITGFRLGPAGAAGHYGVEADITTLGKVIGGGLPVGGVCGSRSLRGVIESTDMRIGGTFTANPMTMVAGKAQLDVLLNDPSLYPRLSDLGDQLRAGVAAVLAEVGINGHVTGSGSIWGLHFSDVPPKSVRDLTAVNEAATQAMPSYLQREGVLMTAPIHLGFVSTAHTESDIDEVVAATARALADMSEDGLFNESG